MENKYGFALIRLSRALTKHLFNVELKIVSQVQKESIVFMGPVFAGDLEKMLVLECIKKVRRQGPSDCSREFLWQ